MPAGLRRHVRGPRAVAISNAAGFYGRAGRSDKVARDSAALERAGFIVTALDLREHHRTRPELLTAALADSDVIWVGGGNTFALVHQMHRSGFAEHVRSMLAAGVTYVGESAGAVACAPTPGRGRP